MYDGHIFTRDKKSGYYLSSRPISNGKNVLLHRYIWMKHNGEIPPGMVVHHKDEDKEHNEISNYELMPRGGHSSMHTNERIAHNPKKYREDFLNRTQDKAKSWHKSEEGKEWHREHSKTSIAKASEKTEDAVCIVCGTHYKVGKASSAKAMFCSKKCKAKYRRDMHLDYVTKKCVVCGKEFESDKYYKTVTCSKECKVKLFKHTRCGDSI